MAQHREAAASTKTLANTCVHILAPVHAHTHMRMRTHIHTRTVTVCPPPPSESLGPSIPCSQPCWGRATSSDACLGGRKRCTAAVRSQRHCCRSKQTFRRLGPPMEH